MKISDLDEMRVNSAKDRAKKFFDMLSERRRKSKREQKELRIRKEVLREAERNRYQAIKASLKEQKEPSVPTQPSPSEPPEQQEAVKPVSVDPATQGFLRWCFNKEEKEELPPWKIRNPRLYRGAKW
jgi:hypothetical protein